MLITLLREFGVVVTVMALIAAAVWLMARAMSKRIISDAGVIDGETKTRQQMNQLTLDFMQRAEERLALQKEIGNLRSDFVRLSAEYAQYKEGQGVILDGLKTQNTLMEQLWKSEKAANGLLTQKLNAMTQENAQLSQKLDALDHEMRSVKSALGIAKELKHQMEAENKALLSENQRLITVINGLESRVQHLERENADLYQRLKDLENTQLSYSSLDERK